LFDSIAQRYDLINWVISAGRVNGWRRKFIRLLKKFTDLNDCKRILDVGAGTGKSAQYLASSLAKQSVNMAEHQDDSNAKKKSTAHIYGVDTSRLMIEKAKRRKYQVKTSFVEGDAMHLPYSDDYFNLVMSSFGLRNFPDYAKSLLEMKRVCKPGGIIAIMEFSQPYKVLRGPVHLYEYHFLWRLAWLFGGKEDAYKYLGRTTRDWMEANDLAYQMRAMGLEEIKIQRLFLGVVAIHIFRKPVKETALKSAPIRRLKIMGYEV
jgi:demethylmenaquinone methyltransferase/2-methoxy-6-polyprenyl-1,4-benzoquinol methylase